MRLTGPLMAAACGVALAAAPALAQGRPLPLQKPPTHAQTGTGQVTTPRAAQRGPSERGRRGGGYDRGWAGYGSGYVPVMIGQDGNVYANFGSGYERVLQQCTLQQAAGRPRVRPPTPQAYSQPGADPAGAEAPALSRPPPGRSPAFPDSRRATRRACTSCAPTQLASAACWSRMPNGSVSVRR